MHPSPTSDQRAVTGASGPVAQNAPGVSQRFARTLIHGMVVLVIMQVLAPLIGQRPLPKQLFDLASPLEFVPWSVSLAAGLSADRLAITLLALSLLTFGWPDHLLPYAIPVLVGLLVGTGLRAVILRPEQGS